MALASGGLPASGGATQNMTTTSEDRVLWDSARHHVVFRDGTGTVRSETVLTDMGMTMVMTGDTRSITTAHIQE
jgi:hypothetical protein